MRPGSEQPPPRIFVTGGNGFIGSVVVRRLVAGGYRVRCLLRETSRTERLRGLPYETARGDVRDPDSLRAGFAGCDGALHLAGLSAWSEIDSPRMREVVVGGTHHLVEAARESGVRTVFVSSSVTVNGSERPAVHDEESPRTLDLRPFRYAAAKADAEAECLAAAARGLPLVVVCPCEVYGPNDTDLVTARALVDIARSSPVLVCRGGTSVVHVEDVAAGIVAAFERGRSGERYILGGENVSVRDVARLVLDLLGRRAPIVTVPRVVIRSIARIGSALRLPLPFEPAVIPYATRYWFMSNEKARRELGVEFRAARDTLAPTLEWLLEAGHIPRKT